jgi:hypothetical protein
MVRRYRHFVFKINTELEANTLANFEQFSPHNPHTAARFTVCIRKGNGMFLTSSSIMSS